MSKLENLSSKEVIRILEIKGYFLTRQKGSHILLKNKDNKIIVIPNHKIIKIGTLLQIIKATGLTKQEFEKLI